MKKTLILCSSIIASCALGQQTDAYSAQVANHYFAYSLKLTQENSAFTPPVTARALGYTGLALYESVVHGMPNHQSAVGLLAGFQSITQPLLGVNYHWPTVANNALATIIDSLWGNCSQANIDSLHQICAAYNVLFSGQIAVAEFQASKAFGEAIGNDVFAFSKTDGGHECYNNNFPMSYVPPVGPAFWQPVGNQVALQPYWGNNRPFVLADTISAMPSPPPVFSTQSQSAFYSYAYQVYTQVQNNTQAQLTIAEYWADGPNTITPPGHSINILNQIIRRENSNLAEAAFLYANLGIALSDAFLACWKVKYTYNLLRPITYINNYIDSAWQPAWPTPPFPEYTSGHASQSGAMSEVLEATFGTAYAFVDSTHGANYGGPRAFNSFDEAAEEAAISRLYGGIHYSFGNSTGLAMGRQIGQNVNAVFKLLTINVVEQPLMLATGFVYPNPASDVLYLKYDQPHLAQVSIFGMSGNLLQHTDYNGDALNVSHLFKGMYLLIGYDAHGIALLHQRFLKL